MTPKEKANELVAKYIPHQWMKLQQGDAPNQYKAAAKQCALIAVEEILEINSVYHDADIYNYWDEVRLEIKNL